MDKFDARLLTLVQRDNRVSSERLSQEVGLSPAACLKRLKRLREDKVIVADVSIVSAAAFGLHTTIIVGIVMERERLDLLEEFKQQLLASPEVMQCYYVTGPFDFVIVVTVPDIMAYEAFTRRYFFGNENVRRFQSNVVLSAVKVGHSLPVNKLVKARGKTT